MLGLIKLLLVFVVSICFFLPFLSFKGASIEQTEKTEMNLLVIKIKYFDLALQNVTNRKNIQ